MYVIIPEMLKNGEIAGDFYQDKIPVLWSSRKKVFA